MHKNQKTEMVRIQNSLKSELKNLEKIGDDELDKKIHKLIYARLSRPSVRSYFTFWIGKYILDGGNDEGQKVNHLLERKLPFVIEMVMTAIYLHNQIYDGKNRVTQNQGIIENIRLCSMLKNIISIYVYSHCNPFSLEINQMVAEIFKLTDTGQYLDDKYDLKLLREPNLSLIKFDGFLNEKINLKAIKLIRTEVIDEFPEHKAGIDYYFKRNYLIGSSLFYAVVALIIEFKKKSIQKNAHLLRFAIAYGIMLQLINDTGDVILERGTESKIKNDVLSDLRNNVCTLPLLIHSAVNKTPGLVEDYLKTQNEERIKGKHNEVLKEMIHSQALRRSYKISQQLARRCLEEINSKAERKAGVYLKYLLDIAFNNRYYIHIYRARDFYRKKENTNKLYYCGHNLSKRGRAQVPKKL